MKKVLIVDDDPDILEAIRLILEDGGYNTRTILEGEKTYKEVKTYKPDLILLDILLSGADGREIAKRLKSTKETKFIPIVLISAHPYVKHTIKNYKADDFIAKPFDIDHLLTTVKKHLNKE